MVPRLFPHNLSLKPLFTFQLRPSCHIRRWVSRSECASILFCLRPPVHLQPPHQFLTCWRRTAHFPLLRLAFHDHGSATQAWESPNRYTLMHPHH